MADNKQSKGKNRQHERVVPNVKADVVRGASQVSRAAGGVGSESMRVEQRASIPSKRPSPVQASPKRPQRQGRVQAQKPGGKQATPKSPAPAPAPNARRPNPAIPQPAQSTKDTRFFKWLSDFWNGLEAHHQQSIFASLLLGLALLLLASLIFWRSVLLLGLLYTFFFGSLGWGAYLLAFGLIAFSIVHLIEGIYQRHLLRTSLLIGLVLLSLLVLAESNLIWGGSTGGIVATLLTLPLTAWHNAAFAHILVIGLLLIVAILTFRIRFGHVLATSRFIQRTLSGGQQGQTQASTAASASPFLGQRPRFSRYGTGLAPSPASLSNAANGSAAADGDGDDSIEFEDDSEGQDDEDPLDDITLHRDKIGLVPRRLNPVPVKPLDREEHQQALQGVQQQPLPFNQSQAASPAPVQKPKDSGEIEPLSPNPLHKEPPKVLARGAAKPVADVLQSPWKLPDTTLLNRPEDVKLQMLGDDTTSLAKTIQETLRSFHVDAEVKPEDISIGPTVIRFGIRPTGKPEMKPDKDGKPVPVRDAAGNIIYETRTRVSRIMALQNDLALVLEAKAIRMEAPVPGRPYVGVEIPNKNSRLVTLREVLESKEYQTAKAKSKLAVALGKDVAGAVRVGDLARMPHLLIAGATGAGKSVCLNAIIASILTQATPEDVRLLMVDPKMVELNMYNGIPHLLAPVVTDVERVVPLLRQAIVEMERRYRLFSQLNVRNLDSYRKLRNEKMANGDTSLASLPALVIIIDELADLMMAAPEEVEGMICRLAQLARATGIHLVIATQRPSVDVITGLIKANIPTRISFMVSSAVDSRTIIDMGGAERLLGRGDMLYLPADVGRPERIQGAFLADDEAEKLVAYWQQQLAEHSSGSARGTAASAGAAQAVQPLVEPGWELKEQVSDDFELEDDLLEKAEEVVHEYERASISLLQRRLRIGYARAARLIDLLEERGIIGRAEAGGRSREVFDGNASGNRRNNSGEGRTIAEEVADIIAEEKVREEALKRQKLGGQTPS